MQSVPLAFLPLGGSVNEIGKLWPHLPVLLGETNKKPTKIAPLDETGRPVFSLLEGLVMDV